MRQGFSRVGALLLLLLMAMAVSGCATIPYRYDMKIERDDTLQLRPGEQQIERGHPNKFLDGAGHYVVSLPSKLILWNWNVDKHKISPETEEAIKRYLAENGLNNVKVRLNECAPGDEFHRLFKNKSVGGFWRYTLGILSVVSYTVLPGRFWGGDNYNPYTNTINIYSDHPAILLHEGGHAKDFAWRKLKGTYAAIRLIPIVPLFQEAKANGDAIGYYIDKDYRTEQKRAYKILYPAFGTYVGGEAVRWYAGPVAPLLGAVFAIPGHIVGRIKASRIDDTNSPQPPTPGKEATTATGADTAGTPETAPPNTQPAAATADTGGGK